MIIDDTYAIPYELLGTGTSRMDAGMHVVDPWYRLRMERTLDLVDHERSGRFRVLDLGCGVGLYDFAIARRWQEAEILGVDINEQQIAFAAAKAEEMGLADRMCFVRGDLTTFEPEEESWDVVLLTDIVEHLEEPRPALRAAHRAMRPGGRLIVSVPITPHPRDDWWFYRQMQENGGFRIARDPDDLDASRPILRYWHKEYALEEIEALLRGNGFSVRLSRRCRFDYRYLRRRLPRLARPLLRLLADRDRALRPRCDAVACRALPSWARTGIVAVAKR